MTLGALTGNPTIRWGDKSYNSIVYLDGTFGSTCDVSLYVCVMLQEFRDTPCESLYDTFLKLLILVSWVIPVQNQRILKVLKIID